MPSTRRLAISCIMAFISVRQRVSKSQRGCRYPLLTYSYQPRVKFFDMPAFFQDDGLRVIVIFFLTRNGESDLDMTIVSCGRPTYSKEFESEPRVNQMGKLRAMSPTLHRYGHSCLNATSWQVIDKRCPYWTLSSSSPTFANS
jgi:hypothetical protein